MKQEKNGLPAFRHNGRCSIKKLGIPQSERNRSTAVSDGNRISVLLSRIDGPKCEQWFRPLTFWRFTSTSSVDANVAPVKSTLYKSAFLKSVSISVVPSRLAPVRSA